MDCAVRLHWNWKPILVSNGQFMSQFQYLFIRVIFNNIELHFYFSNKIDRLAIDAVKSLTIHKLRPRVRLLY